MSGGGGGGGWRRSGACARCCLVVFAVASALCVSAPALYWRYKKSFLSAAAGSTPPTTSSSSSAAAVCPPCLCDCPPPLSLLHIAPDCGKDDPELNEEMQKQFVDLLTEELKLQEAVTKEHTHHMNVTIVEARRLASQYQREVEKCNAATETCEEARERSEAALTKEKRITAMWQRRARQLGWQDS
ncbi:hypothetical protein ACMD2_27188 [Ananas comosus]|uniref:Uncharacterized protein n=1 Tax=Ananas comosus TaxID=4615 RepID=A0A199V8L1_ANACO|nr:hypothetical protein ACMD2_27188 [Ananas comosus]